MTDEPWRRLPRSRAPAGSQAAPWGTIVAQLNAELAEASPGVNLRNGSTTTDVDIQAVASLPPAARWSEIVKSLNAETAATATHSSSAKAELGSATPSPTVAASWDHVVNLINEESRS